MNRSAIMRAVRGKDTKPELIVRRFLHKQGYRYRLHDNNLPGKPDLVFKKFKKVIFINGCFWHGHDCKRGARIPKTNTEYWKKKIENNIRRDRQNMEKLVELGWSYLVVWECELKNKNIIFDRLITFLLSS